MTKKLDGKQLARLERSRDVWKEVLEGVREIKAGKGRRTVATPNSQVLATRLESGLTQAEFAVLMGVSKRTLEQWEQGRRAPSGAAKTLIRVVALHPEILRDVA